MGRRNAGTLHRRTGAHREHRCAGFPERARPSHRHLASHRTRGGAAVATIDTRLDKVEAQLSPQQAVLLWLNEAHQYGTEKAYSETFRTTHFEEYPLYRLPEQMKLAV